MIQCWANAGLVIDPLRESASGNRRDFAHSRSADPSTARRELSAQDRGGLRVHLGIRRSWRRSAGSGERWAQRVITEHRERARKLLWCLT